MGTLLIHTSDMNPVIMRDNELVVNKKNMVGRAGIEPATLCLKGRYSTPELTAQ